MAPQTQSSASSPRPYRADSGPTVTVLSAMDLPQTYSGSGPLTPSPFRWPSV